MADIDLSLLKRIHSIQVDASFKTVLADLHQLLIIHCLVLDTIKPVFFVLKSGKTRLLYDAVFLKIRSLAPQFNPEPSVSDFEIDFFSSIKFVFGSNLQGCLFHYRQSLYRKWKLLGFSCVQFKGIVSWIRQLMALPLLPTNLIHSVFYELTPSVLEIKLLDAMATFCSFVEKQCIQKCSVFLGYSTELKSKVSIALSANELVGDVLVSGFFFKLKTVGKFYQLEANQLREGMLARRSGRKMSKVSDKFNSEAEEKFATGCYREQ